MRNTYLQLVQLITGVLVAVLLGIHMVNMHLDAILGFFGVQTFFGVNIAADPTVFKLMQDRARTVVFAGIYQHFVVHLGGVGLRAADEILALFAIEKGLEHLADFRLVFGE